MQNPALSAHRSAVVEPGNTCTARAGDFSLVASDRNAGHQYDNSVSTVTANVLRRFADPATFVAPDGAGQETVAATGCASCQPPPSDLRFDATLLLETYPTLIHPTTSPSRHTGVT